MKITVTKGKSVELDVPAFNPDLLAAMAAQTNMPEAAVEYVWRYGWTQALNDAHSTIKKDEPDALAKAQAMAEKKKAAILAGELRVRGGRAPKDEVEKVAFDIALRRVVGMVKASASDKSSIWHQMPEKTQREKARAYAPSFMVQAREQLEAEAGLELPELDA